MSKPTTTRNSKQDWFECDANLSSKPEVMRIRRSTRCEVALIVGRLVMLWSLVDQHGDLLDEGERPDQRPELDGIIPDYTVEDLIDQIGGDRAFWDAVISTGWLAESEMGLLIPGFDRRFSTNSKRRSGASRRKMRQRLREKGVIAPTSGDKVQQELELETPSREDVTFVTPERDNRTGQDRTEQPPPPAPILGTDVGTGARAEEEEDQEIPFDRKTGTALVDTAPRFDGRSRTQVASKPPPERIWTAAERDLRHRLFALGVTAEHVFPRAISLCGSEHLAAVIAWIECKTPIDTPDGRIYPVEAGQVANRITQPGRAQLPPHEGWTLDPDWLIADRRRREREKHQQAAAWELVQKMRLPELERLYGEQLARADQGLLRSRLIRMDAGFVELREHDLRRMMLCLIAMDAGSSSHKGSKALSSESEVM